MLVGLSALTMDPGTSSAVTDGVRVTVRTRYLEEQSSPLARRFVFSYTITVSNEGGHPAQLVSRHWLITSQRVPTMLHVGRAHRLDDESRSNCCNLTQYRNNDTRLLYTLFADIESPMYTYIRL